MPKSFLVKKRQRTKDYPTQEENIANDQDEDNISKSEETHSILWKTCVAKPKEEMIKPPDIEPWSFRAIPKHPTKLTSDEAKPRRAAEPKLVEHENGGNSVNGQNTVLAHNYNGAVRETVKGDEKQCNRCQKSYTTNAALVKHQRYYCNFFQTKSFTCKYCDKVYLSLGALKMHIRTHTLPCQCMICGKSFSRPWLLQGHIRTHTGEKPYKCSKCNRAFADRSNLRAHLQTHSDVKKYKCERCSKTFSRMSLLLKHQNACSSVVS